jgi:hypothetical protein
MVRRELAIAYRYQVDLDRAEKQAREQLSLHPNDLLGEATLARILTARGKLAEAEEIVRTLSLRSPHDPTVQGLVTLVDVLGGKSVSIPAWLGQHQRVYWSDAGYCIDVAEVLALRISLTKRYAGCEEQMSSVSATTHFRSQSTVQESA